MDPPMYSISPVVCILLYLLSNMQIRQSQSYFKDKLK